MMAHHLSGPPWGSLIIIGLAGIITLACFAAMFWMLVRPGESDPKHPKYDILNEDQ
ncbi:MAG: hypothetical protein ABI589_14265 [Burkholderiales bacterium]